MRMVEKYQESSDQLVDELLDACRVSDSSRGAAVTVRLHQAHDVRLLMMVLGSLSAKTVLAERAAIRAHGPLVTPEDFGVSRSDVAVTEPWATSAVDQMRAAVQNGDYASLGQTIVDSHIKALIYDRENSGPESITLGNVVRAMMMHDQQTVSVLAAEALLRLLNIYEGD